MSYFFLSQRSHYNAIISRGNTIISRGNAIIIARERNIIARERNIIARERDIICWEVLHISVFLYRYNKRDTDAGNAVLCN